MTDQNLEAHSGTNHYLALGQELIRRTRKPAAHPSFVIYFVLAVIGFAGLGLWVELFAYAKATGAMSLGPIRTALTTFYPALAGSTALQLIWAENHQRSLRSFATLCLVLLLSMAFITAASSNFLDCTAITVGVISSISACWIWWITNANQKDFLDEIDPDNAVGGGKDRLTETQLSGSLSGINH